MQTSGLLLLYVNLEVNDCLKPQAVTPAKSQKRWKRQSHFYRPQQKVIFGLSKAPLPVTFS